MAIDNHPIGPYIGTIRHCSLNGVDRPMKLGWTLAQLALDTLRDKKLLETLWASGDPPWNTWDDPRATQIQ